MRGKKSKATNQFKNSERLWIPVIPILEIGVKANLKIGLIDICLIVKFTGTWDLNNRGKMVGGEAAWPPDLISLVESKLRDLCIEESTVEDWEVESHRI